MIIAIIAQTAFLGFTSYALASHACKGKLIARTIFLVTLSLIYLQITTGYNHA